MFFIIILICILITLVAVSLNVIAVQFKKTRRKLNEINDKFESIEKLNLLSEISEKLNIISKSNDKLVKDLILMPDGIFYNSRGIKNYLESILKRISMPDGIFHHSSGVKFYLPHYPSDLISRDIVDKNNFFEFKLLKLLEEYIVPNAIILDLGANIGNHSMYFALKNNAKMIYAFELQEHVFNILQKNIELNHISNIKTFNIALGKANSFGTFYHSSDPRTDWYGGLLNFGSQHIHVAEDSEHGQLKIQSLDEVIQQENPPTIDFIKCDVERFEYEVLQGAKETLLKYKPIIFIEIMPENIERVFAYLEILGYVKIKDLASNNYLFQHKDKI